MKNAIERLEEAILEKNSRIVAGLDPKMTSVPKQYYCTCKETCKGYTDSKELAILMKFCRDYICTIEDLVPAIKINSAFFEAIHEEQSYFELARLAKRYGLFVIGDVKRSDIGSTSEAYANAYLSAESPFDAITINPYFGTDSIKPFVKAAVQNGKMVFTLVKTSNESSSELQDLVLDDGRCFYEAVADLVCMWGNYTKISGTGYNAVGAVVGATHPKQAEELRKHMPRTFFLVPGYGAQGATAQDVAVNFDCNGLGAIVNSSRGIMCAYKKEGYSEINWIEATKDALVKANKEINEAVEKRNNGLN